MTKVNDARASSQRRPPMPSEEVAGGIVGLFRVQLVVAAPAPFEEVDSRDEEEAAGHRGREIEEAVVCSPEGRRRTCCAASARSRRGCGRSR